MENIGDILKKRQPEFDEHRRDADLLQAYFDTNYGAGTCRVKFNDGLLLVYARSGALASKLRLDRVAILEGLQPLPVQKIRIMAGWNGAD